MASNVQPAFVGGHIGYITDPHLVWSCNRKLLPQDILSDGKGMLRISGSLEFPFLFAAYAELPPNSLDPANANSDTVVRQVIL